MTWDITIGKRSREEDTDKAGFSERYEVVLKETYILAPQFIGDELTGQSNVRFMSLFAVEEFLQEADLDWMGDLVGVNTLTQARYTAIYEALISYRKHAPDALPGWGDGQDPVLARLEWMNWWGYYALSSYKDQAAIDIS